MAGLTSPVRRTVVLDAAVVIALLDSTDAHHDAATRLLLDHAAADFVMSPINHGEVLVGPARHGRLDEAVARIEALGVTIEPVPRDAGQQLARLRAETGCKMPDCCALLAARQRGGLVATFDDRLRRSAQHLGLGVAEPGG